MSFSFYGANKSLMSFKLLDANIRKFLSTPTRLQAILIIMTLFTQPSAGSTSHIAAWTM